MSHKRKYHKATTKINLGASATTAAPDFSMRIQAYEATIIRGPQSLSTALSLEVPDAATPGTDANEPQIGCALIQLGDSTRNPQLLDLDPSFPEAFKLDADAAWVDRYDARLLLDFLPERTNSHTSQPRSLSPSGWSDLPSDTEDTFFFAPYEIEDYRREKRRRLIDQNREDRLRALAATEENEQSDGWGGSDEEPDEAQAELMRRTVIHLHSSPNPAQLEMRILANHGADKRFAFLRGRWSRAWRMTREKARQEKIAQSVQSTQASRGAGLGGLAAYGDSEEGSEESESGDISSVSKVVEGSATALDALENRDIQLEDTEMEARRARAREWIAQRRAQQPQTVIKDEDQANSPNS